MIRVTLVLLVCLATVASAAEPRSGYSDASAATRAMQDDDTGNPGFLWVQQGETIWQERTGRSAASCADCHGDASAMRGVAARYPAVDPTLGHLLTLEQRINLSRATNQGARPFPPESDSLLAISAFLGLQSRGLPMAVASDGPARPFYEAGRRLFQMRMGQLNLSCEQCHDQLAGQRLAGALIPQGQVNGYPLYRLEWQGMGSLYRRIRNCISGVRGEPFAWDDPDLVNLELFLGARATGLVVETPAVRP